MKVLITGANRGVGLALVQIFAEKGHTAIACCRTLNGADDLQALQARYPENIAVLKLDVTEEEDAKAAAELVKQRFGSIDAIINNAGVLLDWEQDIMEIDISKVRRTIDINTVGALIVTKYFLPLLKKEEGSAVINISSEAGILSNNSDGLMSYRMSKAALNMQTRLLRHSLRDTPVRVYAVHPGRVLTDMNRAGGQIEPRESAEGIYAITMGEMNPTEFFVDYTGKALPL